ncbi:hypothetical protein CYMTET_45216 [Cymbomonas tetramitiformis]|uniref:Uncharacterized protein n=1 Tax=Cymbomonas tetramitiformis TaxID=36881 RepID=A0AAE0BZX2_9CHLO|nr:hypothetical protein CYMTET_45216 [Cymbomonas tetramitiformis]
MNPINSVLPNLNPTTLPTANNENYHDGMAFSRYLVAGAAAGMAEHTIMFPVDTVKTRMQACPSVVTAAGCCAERYTTVSGTVRTILKDEGIVGMYRGVTAMAVGAGPAHAVYYAAYEAGKQFLGTNSSRVDPMVGGAAGAFATIVSDAIAVPMDVVKQRLQLPHSPYLNTTNCIKRVFKEEGIAAFFRSYPTTLVMNVPYATIQFGSYEYAKQAFGATEEEAEEQLITHVVAGGSAGAFAGGLTTPMDVLKTRLQTLAPCRPQHTGSTFAIFKAMKVIAKTEGPSALFKGVVPRVMFHAPAAAISWTTYESLKSLFAR